MLRGFCFRRRWDGCFSFDEWLRQDSSPTTGGLDSATAILMEGNGAIIDLKESSCAPPRSPISFSSIE